MDISNLEKFLVVEFPNDDPITVEVVPTKWLISVTECFWPTRCNSSKLKKLRQELADPEPNWGRCRCRILGQFGEFKSALKACVRAEDTSELDKSKPIKRRRVQKKLSSSEESEERESPKETLKSATSKLKDLGSPGNPLYSIGANQSDSGKDGNSAVAFNNEFLQSQIPSGSHTFEFSQDPIHGGFVLVQSHLPQTVSSNIADETFFQNTDDGDKQKSSEVVPPPLSQSNVQNCRTPTTSQSAGYSQGFQKVVLKYLAGIQTNQKDILQKLDRLLENQSNQSVGEQDNLDSQSLDFSTLPDFPINSDDGLMQFNTQLEIEEERAIFVRYLVGIGGKTLEQTVKGILRRIIHGELAMQLSYTGKGKNKKPFNIYSNIDRCITDATQKNRLFPKGADKTEASIRGIIMDFFRFSRPKTSDNIEEA